MFDTKKECVFIAVGKLLIKVEHLELPSLGHEEAAPHPGPKKKSERPQRGPRDYLRHSTNPLKTLPTTGRSARPAPVAVPAVSTANESSVSCLFSL